mgnify:CR=1 FL=1
MRVLVMNCSPVRDGATAEIARVAATCLGARHEVRSACIDDFQIGYCKGCRACHRTGRCVQSDGVDELMALFAWADVILSVSPSYWADVPGQFKAFIDRCTPWSNTHEPHATIGPGKRGYAIALRTGPGMRECERILATVEHFYGHLDIAWGGGLGLCGVEYRDVVAGRRAEIETFCGTI